MVINKVRAYISKLLYTDVMINMKFLAVVTPPSIYHSGTTSGSLFRNSLFSILECARATLVVHAKLYSLLALYLATVPGIYVQLSIGLPRQSTIYMLLHFFFYMYSSII